ncbi:MAG: NusG domain II-containing protein [Spirochaetaceae bacterium]|nr:NusG domain II-containing protein [Spirochaetaceae bacterium]
MKLRPLDFAALFLALAAVGAVAVVYDTGDDGSLVVAVEGARNAWLFPVDAEETVVVPGPLGNTVVNIDKGSVYVVSSPCANQLCVAQGKIHLPGSLVSCLPNRVVVTIQGTRNTVDGGTW